MGYGFLPFYFVIMFFKCYSLRTSCVHTMYFDHIQPPNSWIDPFPFPEVTFTTLPCALLLKILFFFSYINSHSCSLWALAFLLHFPCLLLLVLSSVCPPGSEPQDSL